MSNAQCNATVRQSPITQYEQHGNSVRSSSILPDSAIVLTWCVEYVQHYRHALSQQIHAIEYVVYFYLTAVARAYTQ
eukprot:10893-Heterococcus_DN1.PRE.1